METTRMPPRRIATRLLSAGVVFLAFGCQQPRAASIDRLLIGEVMMHSGFSASLRELCVAGGRLSGSPNGARAEQLVADKIKAYGLRNVHLEPFELACWSVHQTKVTLLTDPPRELEGAVALARTLSTPPSGVTAELIDLGEPKEEDFAARGEELRGKYVLVREGRGWRGKRLRVAIEHGAAGLVFMSPADHEPTIGSGHEEPRPEPAVVIRHDEDLLQRLSAGETLRLNVQLETENWNGRPNNVVGEFPGHGKLAREIVIVCAHLDSWDLAEGALDNGTGSAVILESARALTRVGWQPRRTVRFIWFMGEEQGLAGSEAYVRRHHDELDHVVAVVNLDMPGSPRMFALHGKHPEIEPLLRELRADLSGYELKEEIGHWAGHGSDDASFADEGVCTIALGGEMGPGSKYYHTPGDTFDVVDCRGTIPSSAIVAVLLRRLGDVPQRPSVRAGPTTRPAP
jgi:carboxypeptidase Q